MLIVALVITLLQRDREESARIELPSWAVFKQLLAADAFQPASVTIRHDRVEATLRAEFAPEETSPIKKVAEQVASVFVSIDSDNRQLFIEQLDQLKTAYRLDTSVSQWRTILLSWMPMILLMAFFWFILFRM
jgi:ATP-dependent Zn protease